MESDFGPTIEAECLARTRELFAKYDRGDKERKVARHNITAAIDLELDATRHPEGTAAELNKYRAPRK